MLALLFMTTLSSVSANFNITQLIVPPIVHQGQDEVEIECRYDGNFTLLNWFKGPSEFFRYKPGYTPSTKSFPIVGVGKIEMLACGPTSCRLKLGGLTEDAAGLYRCDIERDKAPYKFESRKATMVVYGHVNSRPHLEGLAEEFGEGELMQAVCIGNSESEIRWYINGREYEAARRSDRLNRMSSRLIFQGVPPTVTVQCAEYRHGRLSGSRELRARWRDGTNRDDTAQEQKRNSSNSYRSVNVVVLVIFSVLCIASYL